MASATTTTRSRVTFMAPIRTHKVPDRAESAAIRTGGLPLPHLRGSAVRRDRRRRPDRPSALTDLELAERAARRAAELLMARYGGPARGVETKSTGTDMVSEADREAEAAIAELLRSERPDDGLVGEEGADESSASGRRWVVDPLDGTTNYLYGFPAWCVSVALEDEQGGLAGVVHNPVSGETYSAERGQGARLNGEPIHVSAPDGLAT